MTDDESNPSRKNSILVREDTNSGRGPVNAHPHFVESVTPFRSPSVTLLDGQPIGGANPESALHQVQQQQQQQPQNQQQPQQPQNQQQYQQNQQNQQSQQQQIQQKLRQYHPGPFQSSSASTQSPPAQSAPSGSAMPMPVSAQQQPPQQPPQQQPQPQQQQQPLQLAGIDASMGGLSVRDTGGSVSPTSGGEQIGISPFGMSGAAATNAWLSKPLRAGTPPQEPEPVISGRATSKQPSDPRIVMDDGKIHILIGVTGSLYVSSVKQIIMKLHSIFGSRVAIQVIVTPVAERMISNTSRHTASAAPPASAAPTSAAPASAAPTPATAAPAQNGAGTGSAPSVSSSSPPPPPLDFRIWHDADEWNTWHGRNDPVIHIELRRWADILLIAPLSANTLGKIAMGLCDNLLTNVVRAWNAQYPILIAPAMVAYAYNHPATKQHLRIIQEEMKWIEILRPTEKVAGSTGGIGMGGMMPWNEIVAHVVQKLGGYPDEDEDEEEDEDEDRNSDKNEDADEEDEEDEDEEDDNNDILQDTIAHDHPRE